MPQDGTPSTSVDVLAAQVRAERDYMRSRAEKWRNETRHGSAAWLLSGDVLVLLRERDALVARVKEAEERAEAHLLLRKEAAAWAEEVEAERDALVARVTEACNNEEAADYLRDESLRILAETQTALADAVSALEAIHDYHCGCASPGSPNACVCKPLAEFEVLGASRREPGMRVEYRSDIGWRVYRDGELTHFAEANPGTPYTWCGLDAGAMLPDFHHATNAAVWCTDCLKAGAARLDGSSDE